jgi:hypothetical protein
VIARSTGKNGDRAAMLMMHRRCDAASLRAPHTRLGND